MNFTLRVAFVLFGFCLTCSSLPGQNPHTRGANATNAVALREWINNPGPLSNGVAVVRLLLSGSTNAPKELRGYLGKTVTFTNAIGSPLSYPDKLPLHSQAIDRLRKEIFSKGYCAGGPVTNELRKTDDQVLMTDLLIGDDILVKVDFVPFCERVIFGGVIWGVTVFGRITGLDYDHKEIRIQVDPRNYAVMWGR